MSVASRIREVLPARGMPIMRISAEAHEKLMLQLDLARKPISATPAVLSPGRRKLNPIRWSAHSSRCLK